MRARESLFTVRSTGFKNIARRARLANYSGPAQQPFFRWFFVLAALGGLFLVILSSYSCIEFFIGSFVRPYRVGLILTRPIDAAGEEPTSWDMVEDDEEDYENTEFEQPVLVGVRSFHHTNQDALGTNSTPAAGGSF